MGDRNDPRQPSQRPFIIDQFSTTGIRCELVEVVHGFFGQGTGREPCSLIVIQLSVFPTEAHRRLRSMAITLKFDDSDLSENADDGPEVLDLAPQGHFIFSPTTRQSMRRESVAPGISVGADLGVSVSAGYHYERSQKSTSGLTLLGMALVLGRTYGRPNAVRWTVRENAVVQDGISCVLRAPILVRRRTDNRFVAQVTLKTEGTGWSGLFSKFTSFFGSRRGIEPVYFDPTMAPADDKFHVDASNLGSVSLNTIAAIHNVEPPLLEQEGPSAADFELGAAAHFTGLKFPDVELGQRKGGKDLMFEAGERFFETMTKDQIFLECARGRNPDINYVFKRFETLSLFNLYKHQQKLVELHEKILTDTENRVEVEDCTVDELADLLRKYHEALLAFVNVSQLEIPSEQTSLSTASFFKKTLRMPAYRYAQDALEAVDIRPESDGLRTFMQNIRKKYQNHSAHSLEPSWLSPDEDTRLLPPPPSSNHVSRAIDTLATFVVAFLGGVFLLAPMFALTYVRVQKYQLIIVVLFVLVFAFAIAASSKATNQEMLGATAAYAAVLVILINQNPTK